MYAQHTLGTVRPLPIGRPGLCLSPGPSFNLELGPGLRLGPDPGRSSGLEPLQRGLAPAGLAPFPGPHEVPFNDEALHEGGRGNTDTIESPANILVCVPVFRLPLTEPQEPISCGTN